MRGRWSVWLMALTCLCLPGVAFAAGADESTAKNSTGAVLMFWAVALAILGGAGFVITRRNLISAVMGMVGTFLAIAIIYVMLFAHFLAAIQVLVYAGAIMVLFVFVIMILNKPVDDPLPKNPRDRFGLTVVGIALLYVVYKLASILWQVNKVASVAEVKPNASFGSTDEVGTVLFSHYLFPFEAVSIVLLVAVVGAIAVARPGAKRRTELETEDAA